MFKHFHFFSVLFETQAKSGWSVTLVFRLGAHGCPHCECCSREREAVVSPSASPAASVPCSGGRAAAASPRARMVDTESPVCPLFPLEADDLESPLSEEFLQEMGNIQDISQSIGEDSSGSFSFTDYQYLGSGPGSDGSVITGECAVSWEAFRGPRLSAEGAVLLARGLASFCRGVFHTNNS